MFVKNVITLIEITSDKKIKKNNYLISQTVKKTKTLLKDNDISKITIGSHIQTKNDIK